MHIEKLPSGATRVKVSTGQKNEKGHYIYETFTDFDEKRAIRMAAEYEDEHRDKSPRGTFSKAMDEYIASSRSRLSPSTVRDYVSRKKILSADFPSFCGLPVSRITKRQLQSVINELAEDLSPKSVKNYYGFISAVISSQDYRPPIVSLPQAVKPDIYVPEVSEVEAIAKLAEGTDYEIPLLLAAYGTLRVGEICALTLDDIQGTTIHVRRDMVLDDSLRYHIKPPKAEESNRKVVMPDWIVQKITEGYTKRTKADIILDVDKTYPLDRFVTPFVSKQLSLSFARWMRNHGYRITMHGLRHFAATDMSDAGIPEAYILSRGGWKTDHVMKSRYRSRLQRTQDDVNEKLLERYKHKKENEQN